MRAQTRLCVLAVVSVALLQLVGDASPRHPAQAQTVPEATATPSATPYEGWTPYDTAWTPEPQPDLSVALAPWETVRVLTVEQWRALLAFPDAERYEAARVGWCESHFDPTAIGTDGAGSTGAFQVIPRFHGPVPETLEAQAIQAAAIVAEYGWLPWSTRNGCEGWSK